ncbi:WD repeat protein (macronuclear) [Tetrahymena thermophila SB210]|uniref:WD repeat protein n=1 Tax=Tetrahymena thermophila (strain SB210) TaxID=312017 RepID=Q237C6_TETTS|nr:WD repeat protein [Tetrahymena thermophila SB210]EAR92324.3 WD repeat protein [Tetrahymena thermophila SB210]|eukprot:XP_001012569.3 WD repeat protein [Tetrahymena thermophila SB210]
MMNTIYEEFDFGSKIKDLQNKKIKIKRAVKKDEHGNPIMTQSTIGGEDQSLSESVMMSNNKNKINPTSKPNLSASSLTNSTILNKALDQSQIVANPRLIQPPQSSNQQIGGVSNTQQGVPERKINNPLFYSTAPSGAAGGKFNSHLVGGNQLLNTTNNQIQQKLNPGQDDSGKGDRKAGNQLFMSQNVNLGQSTVSSRQFAQDLQHLVLPRSVTQAIGEEDEAVQKMEAHIAKEKKKIDIDFDQTISDVVEMFNQQRQTLHSKFDDFLNRYKENYSNLKERVTYFKEKSYLVSNKNNTSAPNQNISTLNMVTYYGRDPVATDTIVKLRDEKCKLQATIDNIEKEVEKKLLNFLSDELSKQSFHLPLYNHSETSQLLLTEIKMNIINSLSENLRNLNHLAYATQFPEFRHMTVSPTITSLISEDRTSVIGDYRPQKGLQVSIEAKFSTSHNDSILCLFALNEDTIATGSKDSTIKIWNITLNKHLASLQGYHQSSVNALRGFRAFPSEMNIGKSQKGSNLAKFLQNRQQNEKEKELLYLASGGGMGDHQVIVWDIQKHSPIRVLKGHTGTVTSLISVKDGRTLLSSSQDGTIIIWDVLNGVPLAQMREHGGPVNCMTISKDGSMLLSGSSDKTIKVWGLTHVFNVGLQRKVLDVFTFQKSIEDTCHVYSINSSHMDPNIIFTGGSDSKIKIWNLANNTLEREIVGHQTIVSELILFENPFDNKKSNYMLLSCGSSDELLRLSNPISPINNGLMIDERLYHEWAPSCSPVMQIIRNNADDSIRVAIVTQDANERFFLVFKIRSAY